LTSSPGFTLVAITAPGQDPAGGKEIGIMDRTLEELQPSRLASRLGAAAVVLLIAAFALSAMAVLLAPSGADAQLAGKRDDDGRQLVAVEDDEDDDDEPLARKGTATGNSRNSANSRSGNSGSRSIGSHSGNTRTGTTKGTGVSRSVSNSSPASADTRTGTTRGTGPSRSVSNSS
jgi:hypothetical protein